MAVSSTSVDMNDAKKPLVAKASDNHISGAHPTGIYTPYNPTRYGSIFCNSNNILRESVIILTNAEIWQVIAIWYHLPNESK